MKAKTKQQSFRRLVGGHRYGRIDWGKSLGRGDAGHDRSQEYEVLIPILQLSFVCRSAGSNAPNQRPERLQNQRQNALDPNNAKMFLWEAHFQTSLG